MKYASSVERELIAYYQGMAGVAGDRLTRDEATRFLRAMGVRLRDTELADLAAGDRAFEGPRYGFGKGGEPRYAAHVLFRWADEWLTNPPGRGTDAMDYIAED